MPALNASQKNKILVLFSGLAIIGISYMKSALELEDAEQAYYSQWWRLTYDDQPPLYTWFQILINKLFGVSKFSFSFLRALVFCSTISAVYVFGKDYLKSKNKAVLGVFLLSVIPVYIDFTFRRLSHTSLLCLAVVLTFIIVNRLISTKSIVNYLVLGIVISLGILTKYNYVLLLVGFIGVVPFNKSIRALVFNKRIICTIGVVSVLVLPHFYDLFSNMYYLEELHKSVTHKTSTSQGNGIPVLSSIFVIAKSFVNLVLPLCVFLGFLFWKKIIVFDGKNNQSWLKQTFVSQVIILAFVFVGMKIYKVETRWLLPLFIPYVVLIISLLQINLMKQCLKYGFIFFVFVVVVQTVRTPIEKIVGISSSVHFGFSEISDDLKVEFADKQWVLPDVTYAGNIRFLNPEKEVLSLDDFTLPKSLEKEGNRIVVCLDSDSLVVASPVIHQIKGFGKEKENLSFFLD
ncbi:glycosyltransferase family 39 protein [uncultured Maribacter sp.]|uniref:ArnT family glycosyltransferase n=1 Tax=uncultured Maribacter sp. TaxID=431308 RepID=UPI00262CD883|nr:glycosyltransferase family 39 protein [uncultured Maribacter sp.]